MNQKRRKRVFQPYHVAVLLLSLVLLTSHFVTGLYARYLTTGNTTSTARVAKIRYDVVNSLAVPGAEDAYYYYLLNYQVATGKDNFDPNSWYCYYYPFEVRNYTVSGDTAQLSEVAYTYTVTLRLSQGTGVMSFNRADATNPTNLYVDSSNPPAPTTNPAPQLGSSEGRSTVGFSGVMPAGTQTAHNYVVLVYVKTDENGRLPAGSDAHRIEYSLEYTQVD